MISVNSVTLFSNYYSCEEIDSVFISMMYDEQYSSTKNKSSEEVKVKKNSTSKQIYDIKTIQAFNVYNVHRTFYVYLYIVTKDRFQKCVGIAKIDNLAKQVITNRQRREQNKNEEDVFSILFFPNSHHDSSANNAIAETTIKCTYTPTVSSFLIHHQKPNSNGQTGIDLIRSDSCIFNIEEELSEENKDLAESEFFKDTNMLESAIDEYESIGNRSKNFGYLGSQDSLCSYDKMNENYDMAFHYMYRFMIADIKVVIPSVNLLVTYPNTYIPRSPSIQFMNLGSSLCNCFFLSLPNMITITYDTIITPTSRNRVVVNVPTILLRVLKGIDYSTDSYQDIVSSTDQANPHIVDTPSFIEGQRFICIGEAVCTLRIAVYNSSNSINEPTLQNAFILAVVVFGYFLIGCRIVADLQTRRIAGPLLIVITQIIPSIITCARKWLLGLRKQVVSTRLDTRNFVSNSTLSLTKVLFILRKHNVYPCLFRKRKYASASNSISLKKQTSLYN